MAAPTGASQPGSPGEPAGRIRSRASLRFGTHEELDRSIGDAKMGILLLAVFVTLGVTERAKWREASRLAVVGAAVILVVTFASCIGALH